MKHKLKHKLILPLLLLTVLAQATYSQNVIPGWKLVWFDEFDYKGLPNPQKWNYDTGGHGWGNHELEYYTVNRPENARVEEGMLVIEARKEDYNGMKYTSARLHTRGKGDWTYGKIEVRAKVPGGLGTWPAIWMLGSDPKVGWPDKGEIDIMEHVGFDPGVIHGTIHCKKYNGMLGTQKGDTLSVPDYNSNFHVYALEWDAESISIFVDQKKYFFFTNEHKGKESWPFDEPEHILLNIAVGGDWGGSKGVDENIWPRRMLIDYVRVYRKE